MRVAFRVDATERIGGGHAMRCLALADELRSRGAETIFAAAAMPDSLATKLNQSGHQFHRLPALAGLDRERADWHEPPLDEATQIADAQATTIAVGGADWLVVDHYLLDGRWGHAIRDCAERLLVIDDLANRRLDCDLLVDETGGRSASAYGGLVGNGTTVLAGARYALLRPEFARERPAALEQRRTRREPRRILISLGMTDPRSVTALVLDAVLAEAPYCAIDVVLGADAENLARVQQFARDRSGITVHVNSNRMAELMRDADLAIGAAGTTSWERCCLGLPAIALVLAENQRPNADALAAAGAAVKLERVDEVSGALESLIGDKERLHRMSDAAFDLTDGRGTTRIADAMLEARVHASARPA